MKPSTSGRRAVVFVLLRRTLVEGACARSTSSNLQAEGRRRRSSIIPGQVGREEAEGVSSQSQESYSRMATPPHLRRPIGTCDLELALKVQTVWFCEEILSFSHPPPVVLLGTTHSF